MSPPFNSDYAITKHIVRKRKHRAKHNGGIRNFARRRLAFSVITQTTTTSIATTFTTITTTTPTTTPPENAGGSTKINIKTMEFMQKTLDRTSNASSSCLKATREHKHKDEITPLGSILRKTVNIAVDNRTCTIQNTKNINKINKPTKSK